MHEARISREEPQSEREIEAAGRVANRKCDLRYGLLFPGVGQLCLGRSAEGSFLAALGAAVDTSVWERDAIGTTDPVSGPAVVEEPYTSIYLPAGWSIVTHSAGALIADRITAQ